MPISPAAMFYAAKAVLEELTTEAISKGAGKIVKIGGEDVFRGEVRGMDIVQRMFPLKPAAKLGAEVLTGPKTHDELLHTIMDRIGTADPEEALQRSEMGFMFGNDFINEKDAQSLFDFVDALGPSMKVQRILGHTVRPPKLSPLETKEAAQASQELENIRAQHMGTSYKRGVGRSKDRARE